MQPIIQKIEQPRVIQKKKKKKEGIVGIVLDSSKVFAKERNLGNEIIMDEKKT